MRTLVLTLSGDVNELSPNKRAWTKKGQIMRWRQEQGWKKKAGEAWAAAGRPWVGERVRIGFTVRRGAKIDGDNLWFSTALKAITDGLKRHAFPDDDARHAEFGPVLQETAARYRLFPEVEVRVEEIFGEGEK